MKAFLQCFLPRLLEDRATFDVISFECKDDLLRKLPDRLRGYLPWMPSNWRLIVLVDRDDDECTELKGRLETEARNAGLLTRSTCGSEPWQIVNRIVIEELEAWYFGDWQAVCNIYTRCPASIPKKASYRNPDAVQGGTWEAFEREMQREGYFRGGLAKIELARKMGGVLDLHRNSSRSFCVFRDAVLEAIS